MLEYSVIAAAEDGRAPRRLISVWVGGLALLPGEGQEIGIYEAEGISVLNGGEQGTGQRGFAEMHDLGLESAFRPMDKGTVGVDAGPIEITETIHSVE